MSSGREEGEIDSEEDGLRKRINELEEENAKYEKIRGYTDCYMDKYGHVYELNDCNDFDAIQRAGQVPTDASSISSVEFPSPKKKKHKRNKKNKCKVHARRTTRCSHQRHKHYKNQLHGGKRHHHHRERVVLNPYYENHGIETISLDSTDMSDYAKDNYSIAAMEIESPDENYDTTLPLSREELRLALGRGAAERKTNICTLKERLQPYKFIPIENEKVQTFEKATEHSDDIKNVVEINSDNSISIEEHELRLIALRSAIIKKHATRKKRNAEIAYSPTDFDDLVVEPISVVDSEIEEINGDMEISPASSPRLLLSPIHCDDEQNSNLSLETVEHQVDNKPIDMDIVSSDSDHEDAVSNVVDVVEATHDIPLPPDAAPIKDISMPMTFNYANHNSAIAYNMFMPTMHYSTTLEMPPTMVSMPALPSITTTTMQPIQMVDVTPNTMAVVETNERDLKNEYLNEQHIMSASPKSASMDIIAEDTQEQSDHGSDEEEAEALRALLLSQRQMSKRTKVNGISRLRKASPVSNIPQIVRNHSLESARMGTERMEENNMKPLPLQLPVVQIKPLDSKPTESILKEAVRRLKVIKTTQPCDDAQSVCKPEEQVPRLTIKSFARCTEFDDEEVVFVENVQIRNITVNESSNSNDADKKLMQQEESRNSFELELHSLNTPEFLGIQSNPNVNTAAHVVANKRRLENRTSNGRTLRIIELKHDADNSCSQHSSEDSNNSFVLEKSRAQSDDYAKQAKKIKTSTDQLEPSTIVSVGSVIGKERMQEHTVKEKNIGASREKENKELPADAVSKNVGITNSGVKSKLNAKCTTKLARAAVEKRKISPLTVARKATISTAAKQLPTNSALPKTKTEISASTAPAKVVAPLAKQLKIVKPNKVINKNVEIKQNAQKSSDATATQKLSDAATQSRILTPSMVPNIKVNKLVIRVGGDAESSSEDEEILRHQTLERCIGLTTARTATPDSLSGILNENIYNSKVVTHTSQQQNTEPPNDVRTPTNNDEISNSSSSLQDAMAAANESFEKKLEDFLKNMRSKTQPKNSIIENVRVRKISVSSKQTGTPTAVRSLPIASQEEYKRLVHRMKILEKQKQLKKMQKNLLADAEKYTKSKKENANQLQKAKNVNVSETATQTSNDASSVCCNQVAETIENSAQQQSCTDEHTIKLTSTKKVTAVAPHAPTAEEEAAKADLALSQKLHSYETIFTKISNNIITRLDKSLQLVNDAKAAKIAKMRHELRLKELRLEMEQTQRKMKEEQFKMSRIYPDICTNNELITKLKQKRTKVLEMAMKLGRSVKGDEYRLNNNLKNEITIKTKGLATHIKLVNSIRYSDLDKLDNEATIPSANIEQDNNNANTNDCPENNLAIVQNIVPNLIAGIVSENVECVTVSKSPTKPANEQATAQCTKVENNSLDVCKNAADDHLLNAQAGPENCDNAKDVVPAHMEAIDIVKSVEEMSAPSCYDGKEVLRQRDGGQQVNVEEDGGDVKAMEQMKPSRSVRDYVSPLVHLKSESGKWDPNDIICPYELMGQCEDKECSYRHLTVK